MVEDQRQDLFTQKKKVRALERKNTDQEKKHERMITAQDRLVKCLDNQLSNKKLELRDQETKFEQEVKELREFGAVQLSEQKIEHKKELKELKEAGAVQLSGQDMEHKKEVKELKEVGVLREQEHKKEVKELREMMEFGVVQLREQEKEEEEEEVEEEV